MGITVGTAEGVSVGKNVGPADGVYVGITVGVKVGCVVGAAEGTLDGTEVGIRVVSVVVKVDVTEVVAVVVSVVTVQSSKAPEVARSPRTLMLLEAILQSEDSTTKKSALQEILGMSALPGPNASCAKFCIVFAKDSHDPCEILSRLT